MASSITGAPSAVRQLGVALRLRERQHVGRPIDAAVVAVELADAGVIGQHHRQLVAQAGLPQQASGSGPQLARCAAPVVCRTTFHGSPSH